MKIIEKKSKKSTYILDLIIEKKDYVEKVNSTIPCQLLSCTFKDLQCFDASDW